MYPLTKIITLTSVSTYKDHESDELGVGALPALAGDDVPLLRRTHDHLGALDLLLVQLMIPRQLIHRDPVGTESLSHRGSTVETGERIHSGNR